ncbi:hypothetical protein F5Y09DRAFT_296929 [Xylaria sp. FL1042]|nr:hypothetical protein F5Y09DRAFT_296929 [Xylaria sp. FL1042]
MTVILPLYYTLLARSLGYMMLWGSDILKLYNMDDVVNKSGIILIFFPLRWRIYIQMRVEQIEKGRDRGDRDNT